MNVINELYEKAKEVTNAAGKKTDEIVQISRLKMNCVSINNEIKQRFEALGCQIYDMLKSGEEDTETLLVTVDQIDDLFKKLSDANAKIEELKKIMTCPKCSSRNRQDAIFCMKCGTRLIVTDEDYEADEFFGENQI